MAQSFSVNIGESTIKIGSVAAAGANRLVANALALNSMPNNIYNMQTQKDVVSISSLLSKLVVESGIKNKEVNIIIPDSQSYSRILQMPQLTEKELISAIRYQADQLIPIPIDRVSLDMEILMEDKKSKTSIILLAAAPKTIIDKVIAIAESAGLIPMSVETETSATLRLISFMFARDKIDMSHQPISLFINFGYSSTSLYIYNHLQNLPILLHNFSLGLDLFIKDLAANYSLTQDKIIDMLKSIGLSDQKSQYDIDKILSSPYHELVTEIERFIASCKTRLNIDINNGYIFGEGIEIVGLHEKLTHSLRIPVTILDPTNLFVANNVLDFFKKNLPLFIPTLGGNL